MIVIFYVYCMFTCLVVSIISSRKHMSSDQFSLVISAAYGGLCIEQATVINQSCHYWLLEGCSPVPHKTYLSFLYVTCNYDIPGSSKCVKRSAFWQVFFGESRRKSDTLGRSRYSICLVFTRLLIDLDHFLEKTYVFWFSSVAFGQICSSTGLPLRNTISPEMRRAGMTWIAWTERGWNMLELSKILFISS